MKNILVIFGGKSQEHDISVITGVLTLNALDKSKFVGVPVYIDKDGRWWTGKKLNSIANFKNGTPKGLTPVALFCGESALYSVKGRVRSLLKVSGAINCTHGRNGEDGTIAGFLKLCNVPLASPDTFCSAMAMDKDVTKLCLKGLGIKCVDSVTVYRKDYYKDRLTVLDKLDSSGYPLIIKPCSSGSSIGITVARNRVEASAAFDEAFAFDVKALAERYLEGAIDINCAAYSTGKGVVVSECERPFGGEILSFSDKYLGSKSGGKRQFPAEIEEKTVSEIKSTTAQIYETFGFSGIVRMDYLIFGDDVYLNEINAVPGSLGYYLFCNKISEFTDLLTDLLQFSSDRSREYAGSRFAFSSSVLDIDGANLKK